MSGACAVAWAGRWSASLWVAPSIFRGGWSFTTFGVRRPASMVHPLVPDSDVAFGTRSGPVS